MASPGHPFNRIGKYGKDLYFLFYVGADDFVIIIFKITSQQHMQCLIHISYRCRYSP